MQEFVIVSALVTEDAMLLFAKSYSPDVVVPETQRMIDKLKEWYNLAI